MKKICSLLLLSIIFSCKPLAAKLILGIDTTPEWQTNKEIENDFNKYQIADKNRFVLDTAVYSLKIKNELTEKIQIIKSKEITLDSITKHKIEKSTNDNLQPVQVRYFDNQGLPIFKLVNCYIDNPFNMDWNVDKSFDSYPPFINNEILNFENKDLSFFLPLFSRINGSKVNMEEIPKSEYYAIVFWNGFYKKPSKKLIKKFKK